VQAHHKHVFITRSVEDDDFSFAWRTHVGTPQEIASSFELVRLLEAKDPCSLWIHSAEHVAHYTIFATSVERLKNDQQGLVAVCIQQILQLGQALNLFLDLRLRRIVRFVLVFERRINFAEPDFGAGLDEESLAVVHRRGFSYRFC
jgi:hypothetical protein